LTGQGCEKLCYAIYDHLAKTGAAGRATEAEELAADPRFRQLAPLPVPVPPVSESEADAAGLES